MNCKTDTPRGPNKYLWFSLNPNHLPDYIHLDQSVDPEFGLVMGEVRESLFGPRGTSIWSYFWPKMIISPLLSWTDRLHLNVKLNQTTNE